MRTRRIETNLTCNQNCTYCTARRPSEDPRFVARSAVTGRIGAALAEGASELILTGGEPLLRRDLSDLVAAAREAGAETITLETNATLVDDARARQLVESGLTVARVNVSGWGTPLDTVTRDPGGFERTLAGVEAFSAAGAQLEFSAALVRSTRDLLASLPSRLGEAIGAERIRQILVTVPTRSPDPDELLGFEDAAEAIRAMELDARRHGIPLKLAPGSGPPPCVFEPAGRPSHIWSLTPGGAERSGFTRVDACRECTSADRCPGFAREYLERAGLPPRLHPIADDRARRRLSLIATVAEQIERELVTPNLHKDGGTNRYEEVIRVNFHCNQRCRFCFVSTHLPQATEDAIEAAIRSAAARGARITLSGGEPTLNPRLEEYVRLAVQLSDLPVQLQTNATRLDDPELTNRLAAAGVSEAFVSLHGSTAEVSDRITGAPGTFARTVIGVDNMRAAGIRLILNFVICGSNAEDLPAWIELVAGRWPDAFLNISFVAPSTDMVPRDRDLIPRYDDVMPHLSRALARARELDLEIGGFESMCGIPLCLVPGDLSDYLYYEDLPDGFDRGEFVRGPACETCQISARCYGIRRGYADLHGTDELSPVRTS